MFNTFSARSTNYRSYTLRCFVRYVVVIVFLVILSLVVYRIHDFIILLNSLLIGFFISLRWQTVFDHVRYLIFNKINGCVFSIIITIIGIFILYVGFRLTYPDFQLFSAEMFLKFTEDFYANGGAELLSIALTVAVVDRLNGILADRHSKKQLEEDLEIQIGAKNIALQRALKAGFLYGTESILKDKKFEDMRWQNASLAKCVLDGIQLQGNCNLAHIDLTDASLKGAKIRDADLSSATLSGTDLRKAEIIGSNLQSAEIIDAKTDRNTDFSSTSFKYATLDLNLQNVIMRDVIIEQTDFGDSDLCGTDFSTATLNTTITNTDFSNNRMEKASFNGTIISDTNFYTCHLKQSSFHKARLQNVAFKGQCDISGSEFLEAKFIECTFDGHDPISSELTALDSNQHINLNSSNLTDAIFDKCTFTSLNFYGARLCNVRFNGCNFNSVQFVGANLTQVYFDESCQVTEVDLSGATLTHAFLKGINSSQLTVDSQTVFPASIELWDRIISRMALARLRGAQILIFSEDDDYDEDDELAISDADSKENKNQRTRIETYTDSPSRDKKMNDIGIYEYFDLDWKKEMGLLRQEETWTNEKSVASYGFVSFYD